MIKETDIDIHRIMIDQNTIIDDEATGPRCWFAWVEKQ